mmetsp:Transcript_143122/g.248055  ORF Transcript_143122/g.248055 Transcript_143122/m.248055 type:complete len:215 (+) Transcript_143122:55-699(+)
MASSDGALHVTGLPKGLDEEKVTALFSLYGPVTSVKVLANREDRPDSAAIVVMQSAEQAKWLIENVSGKVPQGLVEPLMIKKKIVNDYSKGMGKGGFSMPPWAMMQFLTKGKGWGKGWGGGKGRGGLASFPAEKKVWIGGIPEETTYQELQAHFPGSKFATAMKGKGAGTGGVAFGTAEEATAAIQTLNGSAFKGATIEVDVWTKKEKDEAPPA